ncbi:ABC transporter ATP-binding protein [Microvirga puerhi]|uniref:ATP-binding cassette domain-containing protein n=1 Tax=Microvirga puerhi TaxID=2876078 RepID=A0ABS7VTI3_9HYPH|nr:ATP-binding cassette domain-containing protein [Microvirga puerhi]MBZ6078876.1 ATP-binding cassette domain-containing protein [Microvirga puerhi]
MTEPLVLANGVTRRFRHGDGVTNAVLPASFTVRDGDRIALIGASGSGKSTLVHLMAGLDQPSEGALCWPALGPRTSLRPEQVGVVFQTPSLIPTLSVLENVELPLLLAGREAYDAALAALGVVGLATLADKLPDDLSGGQAQRVAIARALAVCPRLILADEPTGQLDQATAALVVDGLLAFVSSSNAALVVATHDRTIANRMNTTWIMEHGNLHVAPAEAVA